ncbi:hypothetical protein U1Q18_004246 [Sarracenia purpurea var. burkii]
MKKGSKEEKRLGIVEQMRDEEQEPKEIWELEKIDGYVIEWVTIEYPKEAKENMVLSDFDVEASEELEIRLFGASEIDGIEGKDRLVKVSGICGFKCGDKLNWSGI